MTDRKVTVNEAKSPMCETCGFCDYGVIYANTNRATECLYCEGTGVVQDERASDNLEGST